MDSAVIFCERTGSWCVALRRLLQQCPVDLVETRSLPECLEELAARPASLLVLEATSETLPDLLAWLARMERDFHPARAAVVAERSLAEYELALRETGALAMFTSPRQLDSLAALVEAFFKTRHRVEESVAQRVWNSLPWKGTTRMGATPKVADGDMRSTGDPIHP